MPDSPDKSTMTGLPAVQDASNASRSAASSASRPSSTTDSGARDGGDGLGDRRLARSEVYADIGRVLRQWEAPAGSAGRPGMELRP